MTTYVRKNAKSLMAGVSNGSLRCRACSMQFSDLSADGYCADDQKIANSVKDLSIAESFAQKISSKRAIESELRRLDEYASRGIYIRGLTYKP